MESLGWVLLFINIFLLQTTNLEKSTKNRTFFFATNQTASFRWKDVKQTLVSAEKTGKICLKNIDKCIAEDINYETTTNRLQYFIYEASPPFDLSEVEGVSPLCQKQSQKYVEDLKRFKLWALRMYDSSAKLPSGLLKGNINQFGDFDMCLEAQNSLEQIEGKYCLAAMHIEPGQSSPYILALHRLLQSHFLFKTELDDPGHRIPRFSSVNWALCIPSGCNSRDLELALRKKIAKITENTDLEIKAKVDPATCYTSRDNQIPLSTKIVGMAFIGLILAALIATLYDYNTSDRKNVWIWAFSLRKNVNSLINLKASSDDLSAIHGIRFVNAYLLLLAHKCMATIFTPYVNRTEMVEILGQPWTVVGRAASLYTDPFILISGTLTSYSLFGKLMKNGRINIREEYISRLFRILPTFGALIAFCTFVLPWLNSGPLWHQVVTHHSDLCKKYWWRSLLFIHNYFGFNEMCLTHTHHIGIDTQLFLISPMFVMILWKWPRRGAYLLTFLAIVSTAMRYYVTYTLNLSNYIHFGTSIKQLFATADNMYSLPTHRATVYIMGIFLGYILRNCCTYTLTKSQLRIGTFTAFVSYLLAFFGPAFMGDINYIYHPTDAAWYAAFSPILWCFTFAWIIYTTHIGHIGPIQRFFSWKIFAYWTKISYTVYLIQFPVFFYNVGITRAPQHYGFLKIMINLHEQFWIIFLSIVMTLFVEMPFQNLRNIIFMKKEPPGKILHRKIS